MISRRMSFAVGVALVVIPAWIALSDDNRRMPNTAPILPLSDERIATVDIGDLCVGGHPRPRSKSISYAGIEPLPHFERDHQIPLCAGGADNSANVVLEPIEEALKKDQVERYICRQICRGQISVERGQNIFRHGHWRDIYTQMFGVNP